MLISIGGGDIENKGGLSLSLSSQKGKLWWNKEILAMLIFTGVLKDSESMLMINKSIKSQAFTKIVDPHF